MKTEIVYQYEPEEGFGIQKVLPIDSDYTVVLTTKYPGILKLEIVGEKGFKCVLSDMPELNRAFEKSLFSYNNSFGLICGTHKLLLWNGTLDKPHLIDIVNPFMPETHDYSYKHYTIKGSYDEIENAIFFTLEDKRMVGFPARFWAKLDLNGKKPTWSKLNELNLSYYPLTEFSKFPETEWLNICDLMIKDDYVYIHTTGGTTTRLKSGTRFEFSIITKLTQDNKLIENYSLEEGSGLFTARKDYFVLHHRSQKKRLSFYNTGDFKIDFQVSLTSKQNLGDQKSDFLMTDLIDDNLYIYNSRFLNICKLIKE